MHPTQLAAALRAGAGTPGEQAAVILLEHYAAGALLRHRQLIARIDVRATTAVVHWHGLDADLDPESGMLSGLPPGGRAALRLAVALATNGHIAAFADTLAQVDDSVLRAIACAVADPVTVPALPAPDRHSPLYAATLARHNTA